MIGWLHRKVYTWILNKIVINIARNIPRDIEKKSMWLVGHWIVGHRYLIDRGCDALLCGLYEVGLCEGVLESVTQRGVSVIVTREIGRWKGLQVGHRETKCFEAYEEILRHDTSMCEEVGIYSMSVFPYLLHYWVSFSCFLDVYIPLKFDVHTLIIKVRQGSHLITKKNDRREISSSKNPNYRTK